MKMYFRAKNVLHSHRFWIVVLILVIYIKVVFSSPNVFTAKCNETKRGQRELIRNNVGDDALVICLRKDGFYRWMFLDGSPSLGEVFDPAQDCSDIVDNLPNAKEGFYWIFAKKHTPVKVWCDLHTDGGGFTLIAMSDSPVTWTIPSNTNPVDPKGPPHWSSALGDVKVLDFAVQVSNSTDFQDTKAHWFYRLSSRRNLGKILVDGRKTCGILSKGIGEVSYVKDILTNAIITRNFQCSLFGSTITFGKGLNHCLQQSCRKGYAFGDRIFGSRRYDDFGSFSYSAASPFSGYFREATAFVGCDHNKCCACFGPKNGRKNYCGSGCTSRNGGTVMKNASMWFWIRTSIPKRLWTKCMEFKAKTPEGKIETHSIDTSTGLSRKGYCSRKLKTILNEGTMLTSNEKSLQSIPQVAGLFLYRSDDKQVYVNDGSHWERLARGNEVQSLKSELTSFRNALIRLRNPRSCTDIRKMIPYLPNGFYPINPQGTGFAPFKVYCDMTSKNGAGVTVIGHDSEKETPVSGWFSWPGSYRRKVTYDADMKSIEALIKTSKHCEQFIKYKCRRARLTNYGWWVSRQNSKMNYWGGAAVNSGKCECGMNNTCAGGGKCNCDANDNTLREDSGFLRDKNTLPVTELRFGDVFVFGRVRNEKGYHTLGKLRCYG